MYCIIYGRGNLEHAWNQLYVLVPGVRVKKKIAVRRVAYTVDTFIFDHRHKESWS